MLTIVAPFLPPEAGRLLPPPSPRTPEVLCECVAYTTGEYDLYQLGRRKAGSPRGAVLWLSYRAIQIADQLDRSAAEPVRVWSADGVEAERAMSCLAAGRSYALVINEGSTRYVLTAVPEKGQSR